MGRGESSYKNIEWISLRNNLVDFWVERLLEVVYWKFVCFVSVRVLGCIEALELWVLCVQGLWVFFECCEVWLIVIII